MKAHILVIGTANMDFLQNIERMPEEGETVINEEKYVMVPGGKGANAAVAFARLGADTVFCTKVGRDTPGKRLKDIYEHEGIDTRFVYDDEFSPTGLACVFNLPHSDNRIIVYPGANRKITAEEVEESFTSYPDCVYLQTEAPSGAVYATANCAYENNVPLFVDTGAVRESFDLARLRRVEVISPNETETEVLTGVRPNSINDCLKACIRLSGFVETKNIVLKLGDRGCYVYDGKYSNFYPAYEVKAEDTTGAGDVFTAALTLAYMQNGKNIFNAARFANAAAGLSVTKPGAFNSVPTLDMVTEFIETQKRKDSNV